MQTFSNSVFDRKFALQTFTTRKFRDFEPKISAVNVSKSKMPRFLDKINWKFPAANVCKRNFLVKTLRCKYFEMKFSADIFCCKRFRIEMQRLSAEIFGWKRVWLQFFWPKLPKRRANFVLQSFTARIFGIKTREFCFAKFCSANFGKKTREFCFAKF